MEKKRNPLRIRRRSVDTSNQFGNFHQTKNFCLYMKPKKCFSWILNVEGGKMNRQSISIYISVLALFVSSLSLWLSHQNQERDNLIAFEQRKQEIRQLAMEGELLCRKLDEILLSRIKKAKNPEETENAVKEWNNADDVHRRIKMIVKDIDNMGPTSDKKNRLKLEELLINQRLINKRIQGQIDEWAQDHTQSNREIPPPPNHTK